MTVGLVFEIIVSKAMALMGRSYDATAFRPRKLDQIENALANFGFTRDASDVMYSGETGEVLPSRIFIGPAFYQALSHHVDDKIQARGSGKRLLYTGQPNTGRQNNGALRFGEQERDAVVSHGSAFFLRERLCEVSDAITVVMCTTCGKMATPNIMKSNYNCGVCKEKAGFGRVRIPKAFELLVSILQAAGIDISLMTREKVKVPKLQRLMRALKMRMMKMSKALKSKKKRRKKKRKRKKRRKLVSEAREPKVEVSWMSKGKNKEIDIKLYLSEINK